MTCLTGEGKERMYSGTNYFRVFLALVSALKLLSKVLGGIESSSLLGAIRT